MKRGPQQSEAWGAPGAKRFGGGGGFGGNVGMAVKMLISAKEASVVLGQGGSVSKEIGQSTGTKLHLSSRNEYYPGTMLQELAIRGPTYEAVTNCLALVLQKLSEETGSITCGEQDVEMGGARMKLVVPTSTAKAVIGKGGEAIKSLRASTGMRVHVEEVAIGVAECAEQIISLQGDFTGIQVGLQSILEKVAIVAGEPWFSSWAMTSQVGAAAPVATQKGSAKGASGKGFKGGGGGGPCKGGAAGKGGWGGSKGGGGKGYPGQALGWNGGGDDGWKGGGGGCQGKGWNGKGHDSWHGGGGGAGCGLGYQAEAVQYACSGAAEVGAAQQDGSLEAIAGAVQALPGTAWEMQQRLSFTCPAQCVSAVIGKGGSGTKEIAAATETKIMIRDSVDGNQLEKAVMITGTPVRNVLAYLHLVGRVASAIEMTGAAQAAQAEVVEPWEAAMAEAYDPGLGFADAAEAAFVG